MTRLYIIRHGNTFEAGEAPRRVGRRTDLPLTAAGLTQAVALGRGFAADGLVFGICQAGKLQRTRVTAETILATMGLRLAVEPSELLTEIDHGPDEDQTEGRVEARIGKEALEAWDRQAIAPPDWTVDAEARIAGWREFAAQPLPQDVLLVTSNGAARFALLAFGFDIASLKLRTGAYGIIEAGSEGQFRLVEWDKRPN
ncbi:histidine phosphatase family protein [Devosia sp.]|uniref:histidine phosphatase family protein n=1 Tax=Devosia sp. TaxID=1871048 RepID=UPI003BA89DF7